MGKLYEQALRHRLDHCQITDLADPAGESQPPERPVAVTSTAES
jgi:hypothetical protein